MEGLHDDRDKVAVKYIQVYQGCHANQGSDNIIK